jgi:hypothetical protein
LFLEYRGATGALAAGGGEKEDKEMEGESSSLGKEEKPFAEYNGVQIFLIAVGERRAVATVSFGETRMVFTGQIGINRTEGSWRYGDEVQIAMWNLENVKMEKRCKQKGYNRMQINLRIEDALRIFREAIVKLEKIRRDV